MLEQYLLSIQEGYLLSDKTISIDLNKFESGESNILLIAGLPASGKSTLGKNLAKKYKATYIGTDEFCLMNKKVKDPDDCYRLLYKKLSKSNKRYVIEGVLVYWTCIKWKTNETLPFFNTSKKSPIIILGASVMTTLFQGWKREKDKESLRKIFRWYVKNNIRDMKVLDVFKKARLAVPESDVEEYKI